MTASKEAPIYVQPGFHTPLRVVRAGSRLRVLDVQDDWYRVEFDDAQWGQRVGFIAVALTKADSITTTQSEPMDLSLPSLKPRELEPMDLSVPGAK